MPSTNQLARDIVQAVTGQQLPPSREELLDLLAECATELRNRGADSDDPVLVRVRRVVGEERECS